LSLWSGKVYLFWEDVDAANENLHQLNNSVVSNCIDFATL